MGAKTGIEWTDSTWNPLRGCSRVSEGCRHCYAETTAYRFSGEGKAYAGLAVLKNGHASWTGKVEFAEKHLLDPMKWGSYSTTPSRGNGRWAPLRAKRIFVNSMSDLFHESVPFEWIDKIFAVMALCPQHTFQVLTKRPQRMLEYLKPTISNHQPANAYDAAEEIRHSFIDREHTSWPLPNVWMGVSVENQGAADERIPLLLQTPAAVRFISAEPLLGCVDLDSSLGGTRWIGGQRGCAGTHHGVGSNECPDKPHHHHDDRCGRGLDWVICGGESGPGARPMHPDWARGLRDQCAAAGTAFFFKQWGEWCHQVDADRAGEPDIYLHVDGRQVDEHVAIQGGERYQGMWRVGKHAAGAELDFEEYRQFPATAAAEVAV